MFKAGIIGCGNIAWKWDSAGSDSFNTHAKAYYAHPRVALKACCDIDIKNARGLARAYPSVVPYRSYGDMLSKERLDIVSICTPVRAHYEVMADILKNTNIRYILAEKPLTASLDETKKIRSLAKSKRANISINYLRRFDKTLKAVRDLVQRGSVGKFQFGTVFYYGALHRNAVHFFDYLNFLGIDLRPESYHPMAAGKAKHGVQGTLLFKTADCKDVYFHAVDEKNYPCAEMDFFFEKGRIKINDKSEVEIFYTERSPAYDGYRELVCGRRFGSTITTAMKHSIDDIVSACGKGRVDFDALERESYLARLLADTQTMVDGKVKCPRR